MNFHLGDAIYYHLSNKNYLKYNTMSDFIIYNIYQSKNYIKDILEYW